ncbi:DNA-directed RNA polymerase subunit D [archaeon]|nr:MAG: DNA-directed RNA polymerase subunit D [archaeon]
MRVEILEKSDREITFVLEGVKPSFASALRRVMMTEISTMAVEYVDFRKNSSALNDEVVANRLGQVPLTFDPKAYNLPNECTCGGKGCSKCQVTLALKKKGPGMVYSGDMKSTDKDVKPVYDKIPIVELFDGQEIQFEAMAQLGTGRKHSKWMGAVVGYKNKPVKETPRAEETEDTKYAEDAFIFDVESASGLDAENVVTEAADVLEKKMADFAKALKKLK